jgi:hypothetical protein
VPFGAVLAQQNDERTGSRRYIRLEILAACRKAVHQQLGVLRRCRAGQQGI